MQVKKLDFRITPDIRRVITLSYNIDQANVDRIVRQVMRMAPKQREQLLEEILLHFNERHRDLERMLMKYFHELEPFLPQGLSLNSSDRLLLATYFTKEYSVEAAALFNPSIVPLDKNVQGETPFVISLRATGEGHISSIEFVQGHIDASGAIHFQMPESSFATGPQKVRTDPDSPYQVTEMVFEDDVPLSERVIFPVTDDEVNGVEDLRMVRFEDEKGAVFYGTYTAYDGHNIQSKLLETRDFKYFKSYTLQGKAVSDKGMALFPQKIDGQYAMIGRQDGTNLYIMFSDDLLNWQHAEPLMEPSEPWELSKIGNCGSPLKTDQGWLLITHGVGPMRKYQLGACLLDLKNPQKVIGRLRQPLLGPDENEREGYVPNVIYTCGALIHKADLIIPYAMSDSASGIAVFNLQEVIEAME